MRTSNVVIKQGLKNPHPHRINFNKSYNKPFKGSHKNPFKK